MRFLLVDRILRLEEGREAVVRKSVSNGGDDFGDRFEGRPTMPACLIPETCDQAARLLLGKSADLACLPGLEQVVNAKMQHFVQPGDLLEVRVAVVRQAADVSEVRASASADERRVARASLYDRLIPASADTLKARACSRMRKLCEVRAADMERMAADRRSPAARPGGEADGG